MAFDNLSSDFSNFLLSPSSIPDDFSIVASPSDGIAILIANSKRVLSFFSFCNPISNPYSWSSICFSKTCLDSERVLVVANSSQNCPKLKSITLPDSGPRIVPTGSLCNASTLRDSQSMFTASTIFVWPGACIATGIPFTRAIRIALEDFPAVKCPVKPSSTAVVSIDRTASVPPLPSRITCPSVSASPCEPIASTWPSINAAI